MNATYRFYKTANPELLVGDQWFIDIPGWPKDNISALEMVAGADLMLDVVSNNTNEVTLFLSTTESTLPNCLEFHQDGKEEFGEGAIYIATMIKGVKTMAPMWLCDVTKYVFNDEFPKKIYFRIVD